ncbi:MAG: antibiotic biosynthesis monooxygenase [Gemmataceae bacterium]|nr:antibiotic biosynthesis monooxygenase [Gemmataceae bacterium]
MRIRVGMLVCLTSLTMIGLPGATTPQDKPDAKPQKKAAFPDLLAGLRATPGCLGVETAKTASGKDVIFAWFEDKKAVLKWYNSDMHKEVMKKFFPDGGYGKPLRDVPDDSGPIMAIASITFTDKPKYKETPLPISQISIELYTPLSGGLFLGGRFAPDKLKVPKIRDYTPDKQ